MLKIPSKRMFFSFFICSTAIILLANYNFLKDTSFTFNIFAVLTGLAISFLFFIPSMVIRKRTELDFISFAHKVTPSGIIFVSAYYTLYFIFTIEYFLLRYTDMFVKNINPDANKFIIALILILVCFYSALKGVNAISRSALFIFAFSFLSYVLIFSGLINSLDFSHNTFQLKGSSGDFVSSSLYFLTPSFIAVIFACVSGKAKNFKPKHIVYVLISVALIFLLFIFFMYFAIGDYTFNQEYQSFLLSKASQLGTLGGLDGLYLSVTTLAVFLIISLVICCIKSTLGEYSNTKNTLVFTAIIFVLFLCSGFFNSVEEILTNTLIFNILNFISAVVIPSLYLVFFRRHIYE